MSEQQTPKPDQKFFVVSEDLLNAVLSNLGEQKLKESINLYLHIQQNLITVDEYLNTFKDKAEDIES